jgi:hypothetical protein
LGFSLDHQTNPYHHYELVTDYEWFSGELAAPVAYVQGGVSWEQAAKGSPL